MLDTATPFEATLNTVSTGAAWFVAVLFAQGAYHKMRGFLEFTGVVAQYRLLPSSLVPAATGLVIALECLAAITLILPIALASAVGPVLAGLLLGGYAAAMAINLWRGRHHIDCGCGGTGTPISWVLVARNLLLAILLLAAPLVGSAALLPAVNEPGLALLAGLFTVGLGGVYVCINQLATNAGIHRRLWLEAQQ